MNLDLTFQQIKDILNDLAGGIYATVAQLNLAVGRSTIGFTSSVKLDKQYRTVHQVAGIITYTLDEGVGIDNTKGSRVDHVTADGVNVPTFSESFRIAWGNYKNEVGIKHRIFFEPGDGVIDVYITYKL